MGLRDWAFNKMGYVKNTEIDRRITAMLRNFKSSSFDPRGLVPFTDEEKALIARSLGQTDIYSKILIVNICIRLTAGKVASLNSAVTLTRARGKQTEVIEENKIYNLLFNRANPIESGFELWRNAVTQYIVDGNTYIRVITPGMPTLLEPLFSRSIEPVAGDPRLGEPPVKYYEDFSNHIKYPPEEIIQVKTLNLSNRIKGQSWLACMTSELDIMEEYTAYQTNSMRKGISPLIAISRPPEYGNIGAEESENIADELVKRKTGADGDKYLILSGGLQVQGLNVSPADLKVLVNEKFTAAQIATAFQVPAEKLGALIDKKNYASYKEAAGSWIMDSIIPLKNEFLTKFNHYFFPGGDYKFEINEEMIPELQPSADELSRTFHITQNEKRRLQGKPPDEENELMDQYLVPSGFQLLSDLATPEDTENL